MLRYIAPILTAALVFAKLVVPLPLLSWWIVFSPVLLVILLLLVVFLFVVTATYLSR